MRATISIFIFSLFISLFGTENQLSAQSKYLNYGFKAGLNALSPTGYKTHYAGDSTSGSCTNPSGYLTGVFFRINYSHIFLQPEAVWNSHRQQCEFMFPDPNDKDAYLPKTLDINMDVVNTNLLLGYNLVEDPPYWCNVYLGASLRWGYKVKYKIAEAYSYSGKSDFSCRAGIIGFSVNISKLYFDFRYEINQPDTNLDFSKIPEMPEPYQGVFLEKNENILSFSCGMMF